MPIFCWFFRFFTGFILTFWSFLATYKSDFFRIDSDLKLKILNLEKYFHKIVTPNFLGHPNWLGTPKVKLSHNKHIIRIKISGANVKWNLKFNLASLPLVKLFSRKICIVFCNLCPLADQPFVVVTLERPDSVWSFESKYAFGPIVTLKMNLWRSSVKFYNPLTVHHVC